MHPIAATYSFCHIFGSVVQYIGISQRLDDRYGSTPRPIYNRLMTRWARKVMRASNVSLQNVTGEICREPCILVGNHISYLDIPLLMSVAPIVFVAKKEVGSYPLIGRGCKRLNTVLVDRSSHKSRSQVADQVGRAVRDRGLSVAIFPSGTTSMDEDLSWRFGAFSIAKKYGIPLQPFVVNYDSLRRAAFIDKDNLAPHLWGVLRGETLQASLEFWEPRPVDDPKTTAIDLQQAIKKRLSELQSR